MNEMPARKPRKERKENADRRRRQLLDAARQSVLQHGLAKTTLATVANAAGLSQGVAVFYFKSKAGLLTETLRDLYQSYEDHWTAALSGVGDDPVQQLRALIDADFHEDACGPDRLPLWFAFWGELHFEGEYDAVADEFEARRRDTLCRIWRRALAHAPEAEADQMADWMEILTDGYWQHLHVSPGSLDRVQARDSAQLFTARLIAAAQSTGSGPRIRALEP